MRPLGRPALLGRGCRALLAIGALLLASRVEPCSMCRCGDPTFNALGREGYAAAGVRLALDWERFDKSEGLPQGSHEELVENRLTAFVSYGPSERLVLYARMPLSFRQFTSAEQPGEGESFTTRGLSDPEIYAQWRLWASRLAAGVGRRDSVSLVGGVKTALGQNDYRRDGVRVDEHAQPGTGSTDAFGGLTLLHLVNPRSALFASFQYRHTGTNSYGYRYGPIWLGNLAYERKLSARLDSVVELPAGGRRRAVGRRRRAQYGGRGSVPHPPAPRRPGSRRGTSRGSSDTRRPPSVRSPGGARRPQRGVELRAGWALTAATRT